MNEDSVKYTTISMQEAASLLACREFEVDYYDILPPADGTTRNRFVLQVYTDNTTLIQHIRDYQNGKTLVPPKVYDDKVNLLRDILNKSKAR